MGAMKTMVRSALRRLGFEVRRVSLGSTHAPDVRRDSLQGLLQQVRSLGCIPSTVIDVGAAHGTFSSQCHAIFPAAQYILIEPLEEYLPSLQNVANAIPRASYEIAVASSSEGRVSLNVHHDLVGSSLYREAEEGSDIDGVPREVRAVMLDRLVEEHQALPPYLIKIDVQGAELDVLSCGQRTLERAEYVLLEVSLFQFFKQGPTFHEIVAYMKARGFVPYDIYELQYRPLDRALSQVDIAFVKEHGQFRTCHAYATPEQRAEQNRQFRGYFKQQFSSKH